MGMRRGHHQHAGAVKVPLRIGLAQFWVGEKNGKESYKLIPSRFIMVTDPRELLAKLPLVDAKAFAELF